MRFLQRGAPAAVGGAVYLRLPRHTDSDSWIALRRQSRAFLEPWEPLWQHDHLERSSFRRRVRTSRHAAAEGRTWSYLVFRTADDMLLGGLSVENRRGWPANTATLGYWIGEPHARRGYMTDAVEAAVRHVFLDLDASRVEAACVPENEASRRLLLRCGFRREGRADAYLEINGVWREHELYARLAPERVDPGSGNSS